MFVRLQPHFGLSALNIIYYEFSLGVEIERGGLAEVLLLRPTSTHPPIGHFVLKDMNEAIGFLWGTFIIESLVSSSMWSPPRGPHVFSTNQPSAPPYAGRIRRAF
jgi:hypothetical protein